METRRRTTSQSTKPLLSVSTEWKTPSNNNVIKDPHARNRLKRTMRRLSLYFMIATILIQLVLWSAQPMISLFRSPMHEKIWEGEGYDPRLTEWTRSKRFLLIGDPQMQGTDFVRSKAYWIIGNNISQYFIVNFRRDRFNV